MSFGVMLGGLMGGILLGALSIAALALWGPPDNPLFGGIVGVVCTALGLIAGSSIVIWREDSRRDSSV